jgi:hypothetical protein
MMGCAATSNYDIYRHTSDAVCFMAIPLAGA